MVADGRGQQQHGLGQEGQETDGAGYRGTVRQVQHVEIRGEVVTDVSPSHVVEVRLLQKLLSVTGSQRDGQTTMFQQ